MPSEAAEAIRTRREDRPQGSSGARSRRISRATTAAPDDWARLFITHRADPTYQSSWIPEATRDALGSGIALAIVKEMIESWGRLEASSPRGKRSIFEAWRGLEASLPRGKRSHTYWPEEPPGDRSLQLYKEELKKLRSEQDDQHRQASEKRRTASAYLDEAIALAHPIALRLLGWLHVSGKKDLGRVFEVFGASSSTFEGVARLHLIGALKFDDGGLTITSLGERVLSEFGLIDSNEAKNLERATSP